MFGGGWWEISRESERLLARHIAPTALKHSCILGHDDNTSFLTTFLGSSDEFLEGFHLNDAFEDFY
jgi:hypothetical protein